MSQLIIFNYLLNIETGLMGLGVLPPSTSFPGSLLELARKDLPANTAFKIVDASLLPTDNHFREAWTLGTNETPLIVDVKKAQNIQKENIRTARAPLLAALDIEQLRGVDVEEQKQILRDYPARVDGITDLEVLKEILP